MATIKEMKYAYEQHKNLKVAAAALGIHFQTLYWNLKQEGVSCSGDKERYGSERDRFGVLAEKEFGRIVPAAVDQNKIKFQPKVDFIVGNAKVEIKAAKRQKLGVGRGGDRWSFSIKKQIEEADFFACFAFDRDLKVEAIFLIPAEVIASKTTISITCSGRSKWHDYMVTEDDLRQIFKSIAD